MDFFYTKFNSEQLLLEAFFMGWVFLAALSPKQNVFCFFSTLYFKHINLSSLLAPLRGGGIDIWAHGLFYTKFYFQQLLSEAFFMGCVFLASVFYVPIGTYLTQAMLTTRTSLHIAPCESSPPVFLYTLTEYYIKYPLSRLMKLSAVNTSAAYSRLHSPILVLSRSSFWLLLLALPQDGRYANSFNLAALLLFFWNPFNLKGESLKFEKIKNTFLKIEMFNS